MSSAQHTGKSADYDRTFEFDPVAGEQDPRERAVMCGLISARHEAGMPVQISVPANVVLDCWQAVARPQAVAVWQRGNRLLAVFDSAQVALATARDLLANPVFPSDLSARFGVHVGAVASLDSEFAGAAVSIAEKVTRVANPGWIVATRPVYDRLSYSDQLNLYSLDSVAFGPQQAPLELLKVAEETDYLRSSGPRPLWGPYTRMHLKWGEQTHVIDADSPPLTIGRGRSNKLRSSDAFVSVEHARIVFREREFLLLDSSTNGTYVAAHGEPHFKAPPTLRLRKPGTLWFGRPPTDVQGQSLNFFFE